MTVLPTSAHLDTIRHYAKSLGAKLVISFEWPDKTIEIGQRAGTGGVTPPATSRAPCQSRAECP